MSPEAASPIIDRCTANGHTRWQHVAQQLGTSVDSVRSQFDPTYMRAYIGPGRLPEPTPHEEPSNLSSPRVRVLMRDKIINRLKLGSASAQAIAASIGHGVSSVRDTLNDMSYAGLIEHTQRLPYTWSLKAREAA